MHPRYCPWSFHTVMMLQYFGKVEPPVTQVTLKQITGKIKSLEKENRELAENISAWKQKTNDAKKCLEKTIRQKKVLSEEALKFKNLKTIEKDNEYLNDMIQIARAKLQAARDQNAKRLRSVRVWLLC
ncbi:Transport and Golgi organization protein 1-like protein [Camelus dromedarius]|uniref:Transport and Golgi organization protein 1-like protein n=1 Tax=Camelus dromedarius TaxID=9838 RepID=A0A5N4DB63_CAMDR|nr:Transport and Golgi organization protein 1-like protein [Camelus dromedarius]